MARPALRRRSGSSPAGRDVQPALVIGRKGFNHNTLVYQYRLCFTMPSYCTGALSDFSYIVYIVSTNHKSRLHIPTHRSVVPTSFMQLIVMSRRRGSASSQKKPMFFSNGKAPFTHLVFQMESTVYDTSFCYTNRILETWVVLSKSGSA